MNFYSISKVFAIMVLGIFTVNFAFAEQVIFSEGKEYEIAEIAKEYKISRHSQILKTEGFTTTGEMFFLRVSPNFEKVMLLDRNGHWQKAELRDITVEKLEPANSVIVSESTEIHILLDQYERVYNKAEYKFFVKTFDSTMYSGNDFQNFEGKISGAKVSAIIIDPNGEIKTDFEGFVENGLFEGSVLVPENLWQRGWYTVDIIIEFEGKFYPQQLIFYVYGAPVPDGGSSCPVGQTKVNGVCV